MLRPALEIADRIVAALPSRVAYALADLAGDAWYRLAPARRRLVTANLARVCAATGRPTSGPALRGLVHATFRNHARYYVELLRAPHYPVERIDEIVKFPRWDAIAAVLRGGPAVLIGSHLGNFEPFGVFVTAHGIHPVSPVEEIEPRALFDFLTARRGGASVELVPLSQARRALPARLRAGGTVGIIGDRDLAGDGHPVTLFGHPTTVPMGPAALAVSYGAAVLVGRCLRIGPDRFRVEAELIPVPSSGDRRADTATLATLIAARFERDIGEAPEQWWGSFQARWPDLRA
ncbi:MAG: hypothetical protein M3406_13310 [Chloroflexota bacterium]|nr:hypothetical protein [Chloroflexota bacterium]